MDISLLISIFAVAVPFVAALTDRKKVNSDITTQIVESVKKSIEMREDDIKYLEKKLVECRAESLHRQDYYEYLWQWIRDNVKIKPRPKTYEKFKVRKIR
jgi:hypothetical protein